MSVYHVYTKTAHIPVFLVYKCQKCGAKVAANGKYDISVSYTDRGTFRQKTVDKREADATSDLSVQTESQVRYFQRAVTEVYEDYDKITCTCPKCGHGNLSKLGDRASVDHKISLAVIAVALVFLVVVTVSEVSSGKGNIGSTLLGGLLFAFFGAGLLITFIQWVLKKIEKAQMKKICEEAAPLICCDRDLLIEEAKKRPAFRDADFSAIM